MQGRLNFRVSFPFSFGRKKEDEEMTRTCIGKMMKGVQPNPELHLIAQMNSCAAFKFNNQAFFMAERGLRKSARLRFSPHPVFDCPASGMCCNQI